MPTDDLINKLLGNTSGVIASCIWGAVGSGFALYGWKQKIMLPLFGGMAVVAGSYFFADSAWLMSLFSVVVIAAIFWLKRYV
jgi:hypothetical protein